MPKRPLPENAHLIPGHAELAYHGVIFDVYHWNQELFDGSFATFEMLRRADSVVITAFADDGEVVTISERQPGGITRSNGVAAGGVEPYDESILDAAKRELREETGYVMKTWRLLEVTQPEAKIDWMVYVFLACDVESVVEQQLDPGEKIEVSTMPFAEYLEKSHWRQRDRLKKFANAAEVIDWIRAKPEGDWR